MLLIKPPYGITETGRPRTKTIETWLQYSTKFNKINVVGELFVRRDSQHNVILNIGKVTDDILIGESVNAIEEFLHNYSNDLR